MTTFQNFFHLKTKCFLSINFSICIYDLCPTSWQITNASSIELLEFGIEKILDDFRFSQFVVWRFHAENIFYHYNDFGLQFVDLRTVPYGVYCCFFRKQFPIYYACYTPPNTKYPFWGFKPAFGVSFGAYPLFSHRRLLLTLT